MQDGICYNNCLFYNLQTPFLISGHPRGPRGRSQGTAVWVYSWASRPVDSNLWGGLSRPLPWGICRCDCSDSDDYCKSPEAGASLSSVAPAQGNVERATFLQPFLPGTRQCPAVLVGLAGQGAADGGVQPHACAQEGPADPTAGGPPSIFWIYLCSEP